ncbi:MAG: sodium:alanine symporter family protein [Alphaproteobacteria bacterium]|nr:sodium:alanine symporter family protein [Alphaproteobacteria bacterium]MBO4644691.1 sodium:alanine symporter family protein [Alphaproteobacteria bacterium]
MIEKIVSSVSDFVWGLPVLFLLVGTGVFLTFRVGGIQFRRLFYALHLVFFTKKDDTSEGDISHFQALMTALAATVGTGNIVGVATAVVLGGPGALVWMWLSALFGMATKYAEALLAVKYRIIDENGQMAGGPMYYLENGLKQHWLGVAFASFAVIASFGIGCGVQTNSISAALHDAFNVPPLTTALVLGFFAALVILGGIKSIGKVVSFFVPFMMLFYVLFCFYALGTHLSAVPAAISLIFHSAFSAQAFSGGIVGIAIRYGVARGVFSNEAGLGSAPIAAAAAKSDYPGRQALVSMTQVFLDTLVICSMTGLILVIGGDLSGDKNGAALTAHSFAALMGPFGRYFIAISLLLFAFSTVLGWSYYGERCLYYLFGKRSTLPYRIVFILVAMLGAVSTNLDLVWNISDVFNGLMAIPNLIGLLGLSGVVVSETRAFEKIIQQEKKQAKDQ